MAFKTVDSDHVKGILSSFVLKDCDKVSKLGDLSDLSSTESDDEQSSTEPRNEKAYLARVGSYTVRTWFAKPLSLSPMICARYGWTNTDNDMLQCVSCKARLCGKLPNSANRESYKKFCNKLKNSLLSSHEKLCSWPSNPSSESFTTIDINNKDGIINGFCERVQKLLQIDDDKLPNISLETCKQAETLANFWELLPVAYADKYLHSNQKEILKKTVPLAVCGWIAKSKTSEFLVCEYCQRQIGLWNYVRVAASPNINGHFVPKTPEPTNTRKRKKAVGSPPEKRLKISVKEMLDPVAEHRNWCPWVNVEACRAAAELDLEINLLNEAYNSQDAAVGDNGCNGRDAFTQQSKKLAAVWEESCRILSTHFNICDPNEPQKVSPFDRLRHVRSLLNLWSSPEPPPSKTLFVVKTPENETNSSLNKSFTSPTTEELLSQAKSVISRKITPPPIASLIGKKTPPPRASNTGKKTPSPAASRNAKKTTPSPAPSTPSTPQMTRTAQMLSPIIMQKLSPPLSTGPKGTKTPPSKTASPVGKSVGQRAAAASSTMQGKMGSPPTQGRSGASSPPTQGRAAAASPPTQGKTMAATSPPTQGKAAAVNSPQGRATRSTAQPHSSPMATRRNSNQNTNPPPPTPPPNPPNVPEQRVTRTTPQRACQQNTQNKQQKGRWTK